MADGQQQETFSNVQPIGQMAATSSQSEPQQETFSSVQPVQPIGQQVQLPPAPKQDIIDRLAAHVPLADRINKGLKEGVEAGFGLHDIDASDHPYMDTLTQTWENLKQGAIQSYKRMGGSTEDPSQQPGLTPFQVAMSQAKSVGAAALTPADMLATGIENMATLIENGGKEMVAGAKSKNPQVIARGFGKLMSGVGQAAMASEAPEGIEAGTAALKTSVKAAAEAAKASKAGEATMAAASKALDLDPEFQNVLARAANATGAKSKGAMAKIAEKAAPQIRQIMQDNPDAGLEGPQGLYDAIQKHIDKQESALRNKARGLQDVDGVPAEESVIKNAEEIVNQRLDDYFKEHVGAYKPPEIEAARDQIIERIRQDHESGEGWRPPSLFESENLRQQLGKETASVFGSPTSVPSAIRDTKIIAADALRDLIDDKYDELGVKGVKEWRQQEAPLIDYKEGLKNAFGKAIEMGDWSIIDAAIRKAGWGAVGGLVRGGPTGLALESLGIARDWLNNRSKNPNVLVRRAGEIAAKDKSVTGAKVPIAGEVVKPVEETPTPVIKKEPVNEEKALAASAGTASGSQGAEPSPKSKSAETFSPPPESKKKETSIPKLLDQAAKEHGIPPAILHAQAHQESQLDPDAVSKKGARGVMQLEPKTAEALGVDINDPEDNINGGAMYLKQMHRKFGRWDKALAAYNAGPGKVSQAIETGGEDWLEKLPLETRNYVHKILRNVVK